MAALNQVVGYAVGTLLVAAALAKLLAFEDVRKTLLQAFSSLSVPSATFLLTGLLVVEAMVGASLLATPGGVRERLAASLLFFSFATYGLLLMWRRPGSNCACFGRAVRIDETLPIRNIGIATVALAPMGHMVVLLILGGGLIVLAFHHGLTRPAIRTEAGAGTTE